MTRPPEPPEWNPNVGKPTIGEFMERFTIPFDSQRNYWYQVVERLCDWFKLHGAILSHEEAKPKAKVIHQFSPRESDLLQSDGRGGTSGALPRPALGRDIPWDVFRRLMEQQMYCESIEKYVPRELKAWGVRNYIIVRLPSPPSHEFVALLANAPPTHLFDTQVWRVCETIPDLVASLAGYHPARLAEECRSKAAAAASPLVRIERLRLELELESVGTGRYDPAKMGRFLELAVDHWARHDLPALLEDVLRDFLGLGDNWKHPAKVVKVARSWPADARANLARAYLAIGDVKVADRVLNVKI
jgi:hypothetical protein